MKPLAVLILVLSLSACAVTPTEFSRSGVYVGASVLGAASNFDNINEINDIEDVDYTAGAGVRAGYRFLDRLAIEAAYTGAMNWRSDGVKMQTLGLQAKFYPLTGAVQPYGLIGGGYASGKVEDTRVDNSAPYWCVGVGLETYILSFLPLFFEVDYTMPSDELKDLEYVSAHLGALFRF